MGIDDTDLEDARERLLDGGLDTLARLLERVPDLATARFATAEPPYDGYFHGATLLHHVAGNPLIRPLPDDVVRAASLLLERGADVDAVTRAGPSQPDDIGWTTLGLVATSGEARRSGHQAELMERLLEAGADPNALDGGGLVGALYYGESASAEALAAAGARLDIPAAAGVGDVATLRALLAAEDPGPPLVRYGLVGWPDGAGRPDVLGLALVYAALHGRVEALRLLLDEGADVNHRPPFDHGATALHWAVMGDRPDSVRVLLEAGADPDARDATFGSTPAGWAEHLGRPRAAEALGSCTDGSGASPPPAAGL